MAYFYSLRGWLEAEPDNIDRLDENFMIANKKKCDYSDNLFKTNLVRNQWLNGRYILLMKSETDLVNLIKRKNTLFIALPACVAISRVESLHKKVINA